MHWIRDGARERLETLYDVPTDFMHRGFENRLIVNEADRQIDCYLRTKQTLLTESRELACLTPGHWLRASGLGFEKLAKFRFTSAGYQEPTGHVQLIFSSQNGGPNQPILCRLDPARGHVLVEWSIPSGGSRCVIVHQSTADGKVIPKSATLEISDPATGVLRRRMVLNIESWSTEVDPRSIDFAFRPGMLITESRPDDDNRVYKVDQSGNLVEVPVNSGRPSRLPVLPTGALRVLSVLAAIGVIILVLLLRKPKSRHAM
jgi:hypothetical protein